MTELEYLQGIFECGIYVVGMLAFLCVVVILKYLYKFLRLFI